MDRFGTGRWPSILALAIPLVGSAGAVASSARDWAGTYTFTHDAGRTAGGSPSVISYRLDIVPGRGGRDCLLRIEGFQANETIVCKLTGDAAAIAVTFHTYGDGRLVNAYGTKVHDIGSPLFGLRRTDGKLVTLWQALTPDGVRAGTADASFERQR